MMKCIICDDNIIKSSIEHIVAESLGNLTYLLSANEICDVCNNRFSEFEDKAITRSILSLIRIQNGIKTKKGKPSKLQVGNIKAQGDEEFKKNIINFTKLEEKDMNNIHPKTGVYDVTINEFDKTEMSAAKMFLKIGFEAIYKSQKEVFQKNDFSELKKHLTNQKIKDWPFISSHINHYSFKSIPTFNDKYNLNRIKCKLLYFQLSDVQLIFGFQYSFYNAFINLLSRDYSWTKPYFELDTTTALYPKYLPTP